MACEGCGEKRKARGLIVLEKKTSDKNHPDQDGWLYDRVLCYDCAEKVEDFMRALSVRKLKDEKK